MGLFGVESWLRTRRCDHLVATVDGAIGEHEDDGQAAHQWALSMDPVMEHLRHMVSRQIAITQVITCQIRVEPTIEQWLQEET